MTYTLSKTVKQMNQREKILKWRHLFQKASLEHNRLLEAGALQFRKEIEKEYGIDTAELVELAYSKKSEENE